MYVLLLPDPTQVRCDDVSLMEEDRRIFLKLTANAVDSACPICNQRTNKVHSRYSRHLADLPWADVPVSICLEVRRFFCRNDSCPRAIFCERLPGVVSPWARRTVRLANSQRAIGLALGGAAGARLSARLMMTAGVDLLLSLVRCIEHSEKPTPRVLGVDDWAKRKGQNYGTILVDLERGEIIDLLADRTAETLIEWLREHPGVEIVTRDRSQTYAEAIQQGAPNAVQVADRWHLLKNLTDAVFKILQQEYKSIKKQLEPAEENGQRTGERARVLETDLTGRREGLTPAELRRKERIERAHQLADQGWTRKGIARHLNVHPKTVSRYLRFSIPEARRHRKGGRFLDPFKGYLLRRWNEGCHNAAQLFREIQKQGYPGQITIVRDFVQQLRQASGLPPGVRSGNGRLLNGDPAKRPPSLRSLTWYIVKQPDKRSEEDESLLAQICSGQPKLATTLQLAREFAVIVRHRKVEKLDGWLKQASESGYQIWKNFAASLQEDYAAVQAALMYSWSNGPTEGHVNRLKCLKREMYGRAKLDLLRQRLVAA